MTRSRSSSTATRSMSIASIPRWPRRRCAVDIAKLFAPFEGTRDPRPLAIVRIAFFSGLLLHFAPSLIWLDVGYGRGAVRADAWNHGLFSHQSHTPPAVGGGEEEEAGG